MGGVQYSTLYFAHELKKNRLINFSILIPSLGKISDELQKRDLPHLISCEKSDFKSSSFSFFYDKISFVFTFE